MTVNAAELAGGSQARFQVMASDGINTSSAESGIFNMKTKKPYVYINSPLGDGAIPSGVPILLDGYGYDLEDGTLGDSSLDWTSSLDGDLGTGRSILVSLSLGRHLITLSAVDSEGNTAFATTEINVGYNAFLPMVRR
jgi:hypothetical protein